MSELVGNLIGSLIQSFIAIIFIDIFIESKNNSCSIKLQKFLLFIIFSIIILFVYKAEYNAANPLVILISMTISLTCIYKSHYYESFLITSLFLLFLFISDFIVAIILVPFSNIDIIRSKPVYRIFSNLSVGIVNIIIINIKWLKNKIIYIINSNKNKTTTEYVAFITLLTLALSLGLYILFKNFIFSNMFLIGIICIIIFIVLGFIYFKEKYEKDVIINKYDQLFDCVKTFEEWMDNESINIHESKNQLAVLREMIKNNKKAVNYIDNIIKYRINLEDQNIQKLKNIPKGGLKGLLYYKINLIENNNITLFLDITKYVKNKLSKLTLEENKTLCRLVGIFFDNAIESSKDSEKKMISCEIYTNNDNIIIIIANTYKGIIELNKLNNNGYSTKGKNRGKGLYLANKITNKEKNFSLDNRIINDYYVQKIIIKKI